MTCPLSYIQAIDTQLSFAELTQCRQPVAERRYLSLCRAVLCQRPYTVPRGRDEALTALVRKNALNNSSLTRRTGTGVHTYSHGVRSHSTADGYAASPIYAAEYRRI